MPRSHILRRCVALLPLILLACGGGGGGGGGDTPSLVANVPTGSGQVPIQMLGTWEIRDPVVLETNDPAPSLPLAGARIVIGAQGVASIGGFSTVRADLEAFLTFPLDWYVNQIDGKTVLYGLSYDRLSRSGPKEQVGLAGGSLNVDTIAVEQWNSKQDSPTATPRQTRSRYLLARIAPPLELPQEIAPTTAKANQTRWLSDAFAGVKSR